MSEDLSWHWDTSGGPLPLSGEWRAYRCGSHLRVVERFTTRSWEEERDSLRVGYAIPPQDRDRIVWLCEPTTREGALAAIRHEQERPWP